MSEPWETCRKGSCHRHTSCMYVPCLHRASSPPPTTQGEGELAGLVERMLDYRNKNFPPDMSPVGYALATEAAQAIAALLAEKAAMVEGLERADRALMNVGMAEDAQARVEIRALIHPIQKDTAHD